MFKLFRRLSSSVYPRPDRPWSEDATSNAPTIGRKRRMDDDDDDQPDPEASTTRKRRGQLQRDDTATSDFGEVLKQGKETDPGVKDVTRGVKDVDIGAEEIGEENASATEGSVPKPSSAAEDGDPKGPGDSIAEPEHSSEDLTSATVEAVPDSLSHKDTDEAHDAVADIPSVPSTSNPLSTPLPEVDADEDAALALQPPSSPAAASTDSGDSPSPESSPHATQDDTPTDKVPIAATVQDTPPVL